MDNVPFIQKISPQLASLLAAAAGWALSGDVGKVGQMTPAQQMEWERAVLGKDADNGEEEEIFKSLDEYIDENSNLTVRNILEEDTGKINQLLKAYEVAEKSYDYDGGEFDEAYENADATSEDQHQEDCDWMSVIIFGD